MNKPENIFDIGTILSITHKHLLTNVDNLYKILNYMCEDKLFTHQLPMAARFCAPFILVQYPQLSEWDLYDPQVNTKNWQDFVEKARSMFGNEFEINKPPSGVWTYKDPLEEAQNMFGKDNVIQINVNSSPSS